MLEKRTARGVAATEQAENLGGPGIEFMIAERADDVAAIRIALPVSRVEEPQRRAVAAIRVGEQIQKLDRRLVLQQAGDRRAGAELIAGVEDQRAPGRCARPD